LRGWAILGIVLHNYCHWIGPIVKENEYTFSRHNADWLTQVMTPPDCYSAVHLLSFFGHYGVPVFLFLSAYGLEMKYARRRETPRQAEEEGAWTFVRRHFLKLFKMMFVGFVAFTMLDAVTPRQHHYELMDVVAQLGMFNNLLEDPDKVIWPGPYWFFGLMLQLYILWRLVIYRCHWGLVAALMVICTVWQMTCAPESDMLERLRYNCIGGMLPFGAGYFFARWKQFRLGRMQAAAVALVSAALIVVMSYNYYAWYFVPLLVCALAVGGVKCLPERLMRPFAWIGGLSAAMFVCHPLTRKIFMPQAWRGDIYTGLLLYFLATVAVAWAVRELLRHIPNPK